MGFFDDISKKVSETTNSINEKTNKMAKESKLKKTLSENDAKVEKMYGELGKSVLAKRNNKDDVMKAIEDCVEKIEEIKEENEKIRDELLLLNNKKKCTNCSAEIDAQAAFCPECGKEQIKVEPKKEETEEEKIPEGKMKCAGCGEIIETKYTFCPLCGAKNEPPAVEGEVIDNKEGNN